MYSYGSPHMAAQKQDDQHEHTFSSYVRIRDVVLKTYLGRWTIGRSGERGSGISVLPARYDDDIYNSELSWWSIRWNLDRLFLVLLGILVLLHLVYWALLGISLGYSVFFLLARHCSSDWLFFSNMDVFLSFLFIIKIFFADISLFLFTYFYLQIVSSVCLFFHATWVIEIGIKIKYLSIYIYIYTYMCVCIYIYIYIYAPSTMVANFTYLYIWYAHIHPILQWKFFKKCSILHYQKSRFKTLTHVSLKITDKVCEQFFLLIFFIV